MITHCWREQCSLYDIGRTNGIYLSYGHELRYILVRGYGKYLSLSPNTNHLTFK